MEYHIGCSGYFYWGWKGVFYPEEIPPSKWFEYYSSIFDTVEINSTFYRFPKKSSVKKWYRQSPEDFVFSVKVNKQITHIKKMKNVKEELDQFYSVLSESLQEKLGAFLFQFPPSFRYSKENIERILENLNPYFLNVVEFRHKSWWNEEVYKIFLDKKITFCSISAPRLPEKLVQTSEDVYMRFHGRESWYRYNYSEEELQQWINEIKDRKINRLFVYFNNDYFGYAPENAKLFKKLIKKQDQISQ
ncbi:Uncharacterized conserved protein YecE, DUF72 family [Persephonella hydrogeniphila]|uniref:Uncharacterized conserved protein YecE, DUF72 family n=1 Tax=Persephonella hydrogeniphila TaxID=198703 RepID=A0A285NN09_9AQUI|nr:DUF72 domain-containing protein [Persephonella hydrogeniphila]SNZ09021.1 Uncharacterized conserved protein YecE, DUF72 family [Persephonella hydrogeniphila]